MGLSAAQNLSLQLEDVQTTINLAVEKTNALDKYIQDNGRSKKVSLKSFRVNFETALPGSWSKVDLDSTQVGLPEGGNSEWQQGTVTPLAHCVPIEWTKLSELVLQPGTAINPAVATQTGRAADRMKQARDMALQTDGTGKLATVTATDQANLRITVDSGRLVVKNQYVGIFNGAAKRGRTKVIDVKKALGGTQILTVDNWVAGTNANDLIRVDGLEDGDIRFLDGIPVFHSNSNAGQVMGVDRNNDFVVAHGVDANQAQVTQPLLLLPFNQILTALGDESIMNQLMLHTNAAQVAAHEEMGWQLQTVPMSGGGFGDFDPLFKGKKMVNGRPILVNIHASDTRWDYLNIQVWGKVKWGAPPFWYKASDGSNIHPIYAANGSPTTGFRSFLIDCIQYYVDNFKAIASLTNCKKPTNY